jgi:hypothetical protein
VAGKHRRRLLAKKFVRPVIRLSVSYCMEAAPVCVALTVSVQPIWLPLRSYAYDFTVAPDVSATSWLRAL